MQSNSHARARLAAAVRKTVFRTMFEAELKYRARRADMPAITRAMLAMAREAPVRERYLDVYFDDPAGSLEKTGRELRVRERRDETTGVAQAALTFKEPPFDAASRSKPEWETAVSDAATLRAILAGLGFRESVCLTKRCLNATVRHQGRTYALTLAEVDGLDGAFVEIERQCASKEEARRALEEAACLAAALGFSQDDLSPGYYTDMVRDRRGPGG